MRARSNGGPLPALPLAGSALFLLNRIAVKNQDRQPGELPDVRIGVDASVRYAMTIAVVRGMPAKLILRYTEAGELLASIHLTPVHFTSS